VIPRFELAWINRETAEGETLYVNLVVLPHRDEAGQITGLVHVVQDVTEMGLIDQQLAQSRNELRLLRERWARQNRQLAALNAELRRLDKIRSRFLWMAAHELRSPLASVFGYVEMLVDGDYGPLTPQQRTRLEIVQGCARRLLATTESLLDVTRIDAGRIELVLQPRDLGALVEAVVAEFEPQLEAKAQHLTLHAPPDLPPAFCDEARAEQIVGNLLSNASKYTAAGGRITITLGRAAEEGFVQISVADTGVGIPPEDREKMFTRFFRGESGRRTGASGTGLGLNIARSLVELHGGRIWFESQPGEGSTFHVTFPVAPAAEGGKGA